MTSFTWENGRGQKLSCQFYIPSTGGPVAALVFHHGYAEHIGRKTNVFQALAQSGIAVFAYDAQGLGSSEPQEASQRVYIDSYQDMVDDLLGFTHHIKEQYTEQLSGRPMFLAGYSVGAQYAVHAALQQPELYSGLVLVSPAAGVTMSLKSRLLSLMSTPLNTLVPYARIVQGLNPHHLLTDPQQVRDYCQDVLVDHGGIRVRTAVQILKGAQDVQRWVGRLRVPVYIMHSKDDQIIPVQDVRVMAGKIIDGQGPLSDVTLKVLPGQAHDLLSDATALKHTSEIARWLTERV